MHIEALLFSSEQSVSNNELQQCIVALGIDLPAASLQECINRLIAKYQQDHFAFELLEIAGGYQFFTKPQYQATVAIGIQQRIRKRLSTAALETLAIIAYKQPVTKSEIEFIRGVNCDYAVQKLLEKDLILIAGKSDGPGKPVLYATSKTFMDYFGLRTVKDLPQLKDVFIENNEIGDKLEHS